MPKVGSKEYEYTPAGKRAAKAESERTGVPVKMHRIAKPRRRPGRRR